MQLSIESKTLPSEKILNIPCLHFCTTTHILHFVSSSFPGPLPPYSPNVPPNSLNPKNPYISYTTPLLLGCLIPNFSAKLPKRCDTYMVASVSTTISKCSEYYSILGSYLMHLFLMGITGDLFPRI